jgi:adenylosuccinate lyase
MLKIKARIELDYFVSLCEELKLPLNDTDRHWIAHIWNDIQTIHIKLYEEKTKHDIKAIEYYLRERFKHFNIPHDHMIHFGLTSQDINSLAISTMLDRFNHNELSLVLDDLIEQIFQFANKNDMAFPARTHGQLAVPTTLKKEMLVFVNRLRQIKRKLQELPFTAKFGGAVGNISAHYVAYPEHGWHLFMTKFVKKYNISREEYTTQVSNNDSLCEYFNFIKSFNNVLIGFCRDIWMYNSYGYFNQAVNADEVGSSTMPQKINPINFENAEGNLELANCLLSFMSDKLQISRMQRDLTDSTILRNIGVALGHAVVAYKSIMQGLKKLSINKENIEKDLTNTGLLAEAYQILLKKQNIKDGYELIKEMERAGLNINDLNIPESLKENLKSVTIYDYVRHIRDKT